MIEQTRHFYEFGPFRLDTTERLLLRGGQTLPLTPKAYETLLLLVENSRHVLGKEELIEKLWRDTFVEEANLTNNISLLRKALGDNSDEPQYIETVPRRGYRFVANVREAWDEDTDAAAKERTKSQVVTEREEEISPKPDVEQAFEQRDTRVKGWKRRAESWRPTPAFIVVFVLLAGLAFAASYLWT